MFLDWRQSGAPDGAIISLDLDQMEWPGLRLVELQELHKLCLFGRRIERIVVSARWIPNRGCPLWQGVRKSSPLLCLYWNLSPLPPSPSLPLVWCLFAIPAVQQHLFPQRVSAASGDIILAPKSINPSALDATKDVEEFRLNSKVYTRCGA